MTEPWMINMKAKQQQIRNKTLYWCKRYTRIQVSFKVLIEESFKQLKYCETNWTRSRTLRAQVSSPAPPVLVSSPGRGCWDSRRVGFLHVSAPSGSSPGVWESWRWRSYARWCTARTEWSPSVHTSPPHTGPSAPPPAPAQGRTSGQTCAVTPSGSPGSPWASARIRSESSGPRTPREPESLETSLSARGRSWRGEWEPQRHLSRSAVATNMD